MKAAIIALIVTALASTAVIAAPAAVEPEIEGAPKPCPWGIPGGLC